MRRIASFMEVALIFHVKISVFWCRSWPQVMFMAYHSEVLQKERDMLRRSRLSSPRSPQVEQLREEKGDGSGARRAGGGSHRFSVMAEAALAQVREQRPLGQSLGRTNYRQPPNVARCMSRNREDCGSFMACHRTFVLITTTQLASNFNCKRLFPSRHVTADPRNRNMVSVAKWGRAKLDVEFHTNVLYLQQYASETEFVSAG